MKFVNLGLIIEDTLIISDLHIGQEEELLKKGVMIPKFQFKDLFENLKMLIETTKPKKVIIAGDLKHEFGSISNQEWNDTFKVIDYILANCESLILVRGNHDKILGPIASKKKIDVVDSYVFGENIVMHGDYLPRKEILTGVKRIIIGHEHPAIMLREESKAEKFKCFLKGKWKEYELVVLPAFNPFSTGIDITAEKLSSPFLKDIRDFDVFIVEQKKVFPFGKVSNIA